MYQNTFPCPYCGTNNLNGSWACAGCGATFIVYCPQCNGGNITGSQFCQYCGAPLTQTTYAQGYPAQQPQQQQQPYPYPQEGPQYDPYQQPGYTPQYDPYQQTGYAPQDPQQQPVPAHPATAGWQYKLDQYLAKAKQIILTTNPIYFLVLGVIFIAMAGFLAYAFQAGLIKTGAPTKQSQGTGDKTPPAITLITVKAGQGTSAIISWVTDEYSSSQVQWGVYPAPNQLTPVQNDPTTGQNLGVMIHEVALNPLAPKTTYQYRVISVDKDGNKAVSPSMTAPPLEFTTTNIR